MYEPQPCFRCGSLDHLKAQCPSRRTPAAKAPVAAPSNEGGQKKEPTRVPPRRAPEEIADARAWAGKIRKADPRLGEAHCGDNGDLTTTQFRRASGLGAAHECRLRALAAQQAKERSDAA